MGLGPSPRTGFCVSKTSGPQRVHNPHPQSGSPAEATSLISFLGGEGTCSHILAARSPSLKHEPLGAPPGNSTPEKRSDGFVRIRGKVLGDGGSHSEDEGPIALRALSTCPPVHSLCTVIEVDKRSMETSVSLACALVTEGPHSVPNTRNFSSFHCSPAKHAQTGSHFSFVFGGKTHP